MRLSLWAKSSLLIDRISRIEAFPWIDFAEECQNFITLLYCCFRSCCEPNSTNSMAGVIFKPHSLSSRLFTWSAAPRSKFKIPYYNKWRWGKLQRSTHIYRPARRVQIYWSETVHSWLYNNTARSHVDQRSQTRAIARGVARFIILNFNNIHTWSRARCFRGHVQGSISCLSKLPLTPTPPKLPKVFCYWDGS